MRGECKTPGGKLVVVELQTHGSLITEARLTGDFFIHPEPAGPVILEDLTRALIGHPATISQAELEHRLQAVVPWDVELIGTSTQAIAAAARRALGDQSARLLTVRQEDQGTQLSAEDIANRTITWKGQDWRVLPERPLPAALNVALDEVLSQGVARTKRPTVRFWRWTEQAVIIGRCQSVLNEVDRLAADAQGVRIVRRMTGGGTMFLQPHGAITYSLYVPEALLAGVTLRQSYQVCDAWVVDSLRSLGVDAAYAPLNDIACSMGKIGGAAQARRGGVVLHHTTLAYDMDPGEMIRVLRIGREKLSDKPAVASAAKRVSPLVRQTGLSREAIVEVLVSQFMKHIGGTLEQLTEQELQAGQLLVDEKYGHPSWTFEIE
jgi:lipoate-protein ligase A